MENINIRGSRLRLPTPDNVPNEVWGIVTQFLFGKMENEICFKIRFPFAVRLENSWPFDKFKVYANFIFQVVFQN